MQTPSEKIRRQTALVNQYRREASKMDIVSPYRQSRYIKARLSGKTEQESFDYARNTWKEAKP